MQRHQKVWVNYTFDLLLAHAIYIKLSDKYTLGSMNEIITHNKKNCRKFWTNKQLLDLCHDYVANPMKTVNNFWQQIQIPEMENKLEEEIRVYKPTPKQIKTIKNGLNDLGVNYKPENLNSYIQAFTSNSLASNDFSNEKLEWLGDRVFNSIATLFLLKNFKIKGLSSSPVKSIIISGDAYVKYNEKVNWSKMIMTDNNKLTEKQVVDAFEALYAAMFLDRGYSFVLKWTAKNILPLIDRELVLDLQTKRFVISFLDQKKLIKKKKTVTKLPSGDYHAHYQITYKDKKFENEGVASEAVEAKNIAANPIFDTLFMEEELKKLMRKLYLFDNDNTRNKRSNAK